MNTMKAVRIHQQGGPEVLQYAHALTELAQQVDKGNVTPVLERVFPLAHTRQAHELGEAGHTLGKIVLDCLA